VCHRKETHPGIDLILSFLGAAMISPTETPGEAHSEIILKAAIVLRELEQRSAWMCNNPERLPELRGQIHALREKWQVLMRELRSTCP
jgi:hypothetical protein